MAPDLTIRSTNTLNVMTKNDIISAAAIKCPALTKAALKTAFDAIVGAIGDSIASGKDVSIASFGTLAVKDIAARNGRNPRTGELIKLPATKKVVFRPASALKNAVLGK